MLVEIIGREISCIICNCCVIYDIVIEDAKVHPKHIDADFLEFVKPWRWYIRALYWVVTVVR